MKIEISSTETVRNFSEILNNIKYRGDRYTVIRGGKPVASLIPVEASRGGAPLANLRQIMDELPHLDDDDTAFSDDVIDAAKIQPEIPEAQTWE